MSFLGFVRPDGSVGTRNYVLIVPGGIIASKICDFVRGAETILTANIGTGRTAADRETVARVLIGLGRSPNVASVIVNAAGCGAGYSELSAQRLADEIAASGKRVEIIDPAKDGGSYGAMMKGMQLARQMVYDASRLRRQVVSDEHLCVAVKCGYSDPTSGVAGNPAVGCAFDRIVAGGGTALFGETVEVIGAEHAITKRAVSPEVADAILRAVEHQEARAKSAGLEIRAINPIPANIKGGITTLEEKSLGAIHKAGSMPIQGVLKYGERPQGRGLYFVDNWAVNTSIFAGYAAAGANVVIFQYGGGGVTGRTLLEPAPSPLVPQLWSTANRRTYEAAEDSVDFYSGTVVEGSESIEEAGERLHQVILDVASGTSARSETVNYKDPFEIYLQDPQF
jgi:altronate dehydratase large subunit